MNFLKKRILITCLAICCSYNTIHCVDGIGTPKSTAEGRAQVAMVVATMFISSLAGQAVKAFQHDTGIKLYNVKLFKQAIAILGSFFIAYIVNDLSDDGSINFSPGRVWEHGWYGALQFAFKKALWTVPAYLAWIGVDQATTRDDNEEKR